MPMHYTHNLPVISTIIYPFLTTMAQSPCVKTAESLEIFITQFALAPNEETVRWLLKTL